MPPSTGRRSRPKIVGPISACIHVRWRRACVVSFDKITGEMTLYGTFQAPHVIRTVVSLMRAFPSKDPRDLARHRRRLRQQGRRLPGLRLRRRRLDRDRRAGQMGRGPHRESLDDGVRARLPHDAEIAATQRRQGHGLARSHPRRPRRVRRLRRPTKWPAGFSNIVTGSYDFPVAHLLGRRRLHQQGAGRRRLSLLVPRDRSRLCDRARDGHHGAEARAWTRSNSA